MEHDVLAETGNIVLNAFLGMSQRISMSLPSVIRGSGARLFEDQGETSNPVLLLYIDFIIRDRNLQGFIALLMDLPAITALKLLVRDFIKGIDQ